MIFVNFYVQQVEPETQTKSDVTESDTHKVVIYFVLVLFKTCVFVIWVILSVCE